MTWGDPNSRAGRAVTRRAQKGLRTPERRRAWLRSREPDTPERAAAKRRHPRVWGERPERKWGARMALVVLLLVVAAILIAGRHASGLFLLIVVLVAGARLAKAR